METSNNLVQPFRLSCRSYPTYEEWKLVFQGLVLGTTGVRSYPTYEEWKQVSSNHSCAGFGVLILPMRNGNAFSPSFSHRYHVGSYPTYEEWKLYKFVS